MIPRRSVALLLVTLLSSCSEPGAKVTIPFAPVLGTQSLRCDDADDDVQLTDLRFYVADVQLITVEGELVDVQLEADGRWQQAQLALIDLENGSDACTNGTAEMNTNLRGAIPQAEYRGLQFTVGVPFEDNHGDPLQAQPPLGDTAMHWHWRGGYKFLRAGVRTADDGFWIHLGSTGCEGTVRNITGCRSPNRVSVRLDEFNVAADTVVIDLGAFFAQGDLEDHVANDCSSGPAEEHCNAAFGALGLEHATGNRREEQRVFRRKVAD